MKKMMMMVAFMAAIGAQAGSVNWTTSAALKGVDQTGAVTAVNVTSSYVSYLFVVAAGQGQAAYDALVLNMTTEGGSAKAGFVGANDGVSKYITSTYTVGKISQTSKASSLVVASGKYDAYMITFDPTGGNEYFEAALVLNQQANASGVLAANFVVTSGEVGTGWTPIATVPEPASVALLALGGAVFGLRRKFRK